MATSRTERDLARGRRAAARVTMCGGSAFAAASVHIEATFSPALHRSMLKDRVAVLIRRGATHPKVRARYRNLVQRHPVRNLDAAIILAGRIHCAEREARAATMRNCGRASLSRLNLMLLDEVRLILRLLRRYAPALFAEIVMEMQAGFTTSSGASTAAE